MKNALVRESRKYPRTSNKCNKCHSNSIRYRRTYGWWNSRIRSPVVIYVNPVRRFTEMRARTARGGCPCKFTDRVHLSALRNPFAHRGIPGSTRRHEGAQLTPSRKRVPSVRGGTSAGRGERTRTRASGEQRVEKTVLLSFSRACESSGHAPRMISRLPCSVHRLPVSAVFIKR